ncbi:MAG TPA: zf-HC2 domain-containing protein [Candidatus Ozemobacteraceae bacterium]|nr:zf-HC2 domain-containing protein [Candidatus Ozemobacteraceae bacterium]
MNPNPKPCHEQIDFQAYFDQQATLPERTRIERHIRQCAACRVEFDVWRDLFARLGESYALNAADRPDATRLQALFDRLAARNSPSGIPPLPAQTQAAQNSVFGVVAELIRMQRWLAGGLALCFVLMLALVFRDRGLPHAPAAAPSDGLVRPAPAPAPATRGFYTYRLSAPPGQTLSRLEPAGSGPDPHDAGSGPAAPGWRGSAGPALPSEGALEPGVTYRVPPLGILFVEFHGENRIQFTSQARFLLTATGTRLLSGQVTCDLRSSGNGFEVTTRAGTVMGLGGQFLVEERPASSRITLDAGAVRIGTRRLSVTMDSPGSRFLMADGSIRLDAGDNQPRPIAGAAGLTPAE